MGDLIDLFKEALVYPLSNIVILLILGALLVITKVPDILITWGVDFDLSIVTGFSLIAFIVSLFMDGYSLGVIKDAIEFNVSMPGIDIMKNFIDGVKVWILKIVYYIVPTLITIFVALLSGGFDAIFNIIRFVINDDTALTLLNSPVEFLNAIPQEYLAALIGSILITATVAIILYIIFGLLYNIGLCRFAKYDNFYEGIKIREIINDMKDIGIGKYILWYILLFLIILVISCVVALINAIPYIGIILVNLICAPFIYLLINRSLGLLYANAKGFDK